MLEVANRDRDGAVIGLFNCKETHVFVAKASALYFAGCVIWYIIFCLEVMGSVGSRA